MSGITPFVMLPGAGPACEGDDCLPAVPNADVPLDALLEPENGHPVASPRFGVAS